MLLQDFFFKFMKSRFLMYIRKENMQNRPRRLGNAIFRSFTIFVNKNYSDGVLTYLWARDITVPSGDPETLEYNFAAKTGLVFFVFQTSTSLGAPNGFQ